MGELKDDLAVKPERCLFTAFSGFSGPWGFRIGHSESFYPKDNNFAETLGHYVCSEIQRYILKTCVFLQETSYAPVEQLRILSMHF